jgi:hypothetical protein
LKAIFRESVRNNRSEIFPVRDNQDSGQSRTTRVILGQDAGIIE